MIWQRAIFQPAVYMMASRKRGTLYVGVTSHLQQRIYQHRSGTIEGFTKQYQCKCLVWLEIHTTMEQAIAREKQLKGGSRQDKIFLIEDQNPEWQDLYDVVCLP
jgi:putative endonuclease